MAKRTVLYEDGTFIFNELDTDISANVEKHGQAVSTFGELRGNVQFSSPTSRDYNSVCSSIRKVEFGSEIAPIYICYWFCNMENCESIDLTGVDTSGCYLMTGAFQNCGASDVNYEVLDTSTAQLMNYMFAYNKADSIDVSGFDTSNVTTMQYMFYECYNITELNLRSFDTANCRDFSNMFGDCPALKTIYATDKFVTTASTSTAAVFKNNTALVGGAGTAYIPTLYNNKPYARIDNPPDEPGYFTLWKRKKEILKPDICGDRLNPFETDEPCNGSLHIDGVEDVTINQGVGIDLTEGVTAYDADGEEVSFTVSPSEIAKCDVGEHTVTYTAIGEDNSILKPTICGSDALTTEDCGLGMVKETRLVTIEQADPPTINGVGDAIVAPHGSLNLMNGVSGVDDNGNTTEVSWSGGTYDDEASGDIATFETDLEAPLKSLKVMLEPKQPCTPWIGTAHDTTPYLNRAMPTQSNDYNRESGVIVGGTVGWNQLINPSGYNTQTVNGVTMTKNDDGSVTFSGTATADASFSLVNTRDNPLVKGRVYYVHTCPENGGRTTYYGGVAGLRYDFGDGAIFKHSYDWGTTDVRLDVVSGTTISGTVYPQFIDLTAMFNPTIADYVYSLEQANSGDGVAWFRKYFPEDYYPYSANTLQSVQATAHKTYDSGGNVIGNYALDSSLTLRGIPKLDASNNLYYDGDTYASYGSVTRNTILRAYQSGDESLANAITDGTNTVVYSANASTETAQPYTNPQVVDPDGTEEYVTANYVPVGHDSTYSLVCPISGYDEVSAYVTDEQKYNFSNVVIGKNWIGGTDATRATLTFDAEPSTRYRVITEGGNFSTILFIRMERYTQITNIGINPPFDGYITTESNCDKVIVQFQKSTAITADDFSDFKCSISKEYESYTASLPETVYGGTVDLVSGVVVIDRAMVTYSSVYSVAQGTSQPLYYWMFATNPKAPTNNEANLISDQYVLGGFAIGKCYITNTGQLIVAVPADQTLNTRALANAWLAQNPVQFCYELATPRTIQLTPQEIQTLLGTNNVWGEDGEVYVVFTKTITDVNTTFNVEGVYEVTYTTEDECGNETTVTRKIYVQTTQYRFVGIEDVTINQGTDFDPTEGIKAYNAQGQEVNYTVSPSEVDTCEVGTQTLTYTVGGLTETRTVTVEAISDPEIWNVTTPIQAEANVEFDPLDNVYAFDGNGNRIDVTAAYAKRTVIYSDGTLIINEPSSDIAENVSLHGNATNVYEPLNEDGTNYVWTGEPHTLWHESYTVKESINRVEIGSPIRPTSIAYWFYQLRYCKEIELSNLDTSRCTNMRYAFANVGLGVSTQDAVPYLDLSHFDTSNVTDMDYMFSHLYGAKVIDVSSWDTSAVETMYYMFAYCNLTETIYASDSFVTPYSTPSYGFFLDCNELVGGQGTAYDQRPTNFNTSLYARIDNPPTEPGYFTAV